MDNIVDSKWVFDLKKDDVGHINVKARVGPPRFNQRGGVDFSETFAAAVDGARVRLLAAIAYFGILICVILMYSCSFCPT